jgi:hypothetical protein
VSPFGVTTVEGKPGTLRALYPTSLGGRRVLGTMLWVDQSDPTLPYFNEQTEGLLDSRLFMSISEDEGQTWGAPWRVDTTPFHVPTPSTGATLVLKNGEWACQFELNKHYNDPVVWRHSSVLIFSKDGGRTWPAHAITSNDPENRIFYWDQRPAVMGDGSLLDVFWTYDNKAAQYLNIHARESHDNGRSWSSIWDTGIAQQPAQPVSLPDGRIALVYVDRAGAPAIRLRTSSDRGRTWPAETEVTLYGAVLPSQTVQKGVMQDAWAEMAKFSVGLPATAPLPDGGVLVVYYAGPAMDVTDIKWARIGE